MNNGRVFFAFSSVDDKTGNATFHVAIFEEAQDESLRVVS